MSAFVKPWIEKWLLERLNASLNADLSEASSLQQRLHIVNQAKWSSTPFQRSQLIRFTAAPVPGHLGTVKLEISDLCSWIEAVLTDNCYKNWLTNESQKNNGDLGPAITTLKGGFITLKKYMVVFNHDLKTNQVSLQIQIDDFDYKGSQDNNVIGNLNHYRSIRSLKDPLSLMDQFITFPVLEGHTKSTGSFSAIIDCEIGTVEVEGTAFTADKSLLAVERTRFLTQSQISSNGYRGSGTAFEIASLNALKNQIPLHKGWGNLDQSIQIPSDQQMILDSISPRRITYGRNDDDCDDEEEWGQNCPVLIDPVTPRTKTNLHKSAVQSSLQENPPKAEDPRIIDNNDSDREIRDHFHEFGTPESSKTNGGFIIEGPASFTPKPQGPLILSPLNITPTLRSRPEILSGGSSDNDGADGTTSLLLSICNENIVSQSRCSTPKDDGPAAFLFSTQAPGDSPGISDVCSSPISNDQKNHANSMLPEYFDEIDDSASVQTQDNTELSQPEKKSNVTAIDLEASIKGELMECARPIDFLNSSELVLTSQKDIAGPIECVQIAVPSSLNLENEKIKNPQTPTVPPSKMGFFAKLKELTAILVSSVSKIPRARRGTNDPAIVVKTPAFEVDADFNGKGDTVASRTAHEFGGSEMDIVEPENTLCVLPVKMIEVASDTVQIEDIEMFPEDQVDRELIDPSVINQSEDVNMGVIINAETSQDKVKEKDFSTLDNSASVQIIDVEPESDKTDFIEEDWTIDEHTDRNYQSSNEILSSVSLMADLPFCDKSVAESAKTNYVGLAENEIVMTPSQLKQDSLDNIYNHIQKSFSFDTSEGDERILQVLSGISDAQRCESSDNSSVMGMQSTSDTDEENFDTQEAEISFLSNFKTISPPTHQVSVVIESRNPKSYSDSLDIPIAAESFPEVSMTASLNYSPIRGFSQISELPNGFSIGGTPEKTKASSKAVEVVPKPRFTPRKALAEGGVAKKRATPLKLSPNRPFSKKPKNGWSKLINASKNDPKSPKVNESTRYQRHSAPFKLFLQDPSIKTSMATKFVQDYLSHVPGFLSRNFSITSAASKPRSKILILADDETVEPYVAPILSQAKDTAAEAALKEKHDDITGSVKASIEDVGGVDVFDHDSPLDQDVEETIPDSQNLKDLFSGTQDERISPSDTVIATEAGFVISNEIKESQVKDGPIELVETEPKTAYSTVKYLLNSKKRAAEEQISTYKRAKNLEPTNENREHTQTNSGDKNDRVSSRPNAFRPNTGIPSLLKLVERAKALRTKMQK